MRSVMYSFCFFIYRSLSNPIFARHGGTHSLLLEFMHDDRLESLAETAAELNRWAHAFD